MMKLHAIRIKHGEDLYQGIKSFVEERNIKAGFIVGGAAGLTTLNLRLPSTPTKRPLLQQKGKYEVVSMAGTVGTEAMHIHISVGDQKGAVLGHLMKSGNAVNFTAEIGIVEDDRLVFSREMDDQTGFTELRVEEND